MLNNEDLSLGLLATDEPHRWEIEPHLITDFDVLVTNSDDAARRAILEIAESYLWDTNEPGQERVMRVRMSDVPNDAQRHPVRETAASAPATDEVERALTELREIFPDRSIFITYADQDYSNDHSHREGSVLIQIRTLPSRYS